MTLFQTIAMWSLRALVLWGGAELGLQVYQNIASDLTIIQDIQNHTPALVRLTERARNAEHRAQQAEVELREAQGQSWTLERSDGPADRNMLAAQSLRETLLSLGAQAPVVDTEQTTPDNPDRAALFARWREPAQTAPNVFLSLSSRVAALRITSLKMNADPNGVVTIEAHLNATINVEERHP